MTACDCRKPQMLGTINLTRFNRCSYVPKKVTHDGLVAYEIFQLRKQSNKISGYACRQRNVGQKVREFWTGSTDHQSFENAINLGSADCWRMIQTSLCGMNPMSRQGNIWKFEASPNVNPQWLHTIQEEMPNCYFEKISFEIFDGIPGVFSYAGNISDDFSTGYALIMGTTYVWTPTDASNVSHCQVTSIYNGTGQIDHVKVSDGNPSAVRLSDKESQTDFFIGRIAHVCETYELHAVAAEPEIFIRYFFRPSSSDVRKPDLWDENATHPWRGRIAAYLGAHLNYYEQTYLEYFEGIHGDLK